MGSSWQIWAARAGGKGAALPVPHVQQTTGYTCGPACLLAAAQYFGVPTSEKALATAAGTSTSGTTPDGLVAAAQAVGLGAELREDLTLEDLAAQLRDGALVIVALQAWAAGGPPAAGYGERWGEGHYVVVVGEAEGDVLVEDPATDGLARTSAAQLRVRWHDIDTRLRHGLGIIVWAEREPEPVVPDAPVSLG